MASVLFDDLFAVSDVDVCLNSFYDIFCEVVSSCKTKVNINNMLNRSRLINPWIKNTL